MTLLGDGKVLLAGPGQNDTALLDPGTMTWTNLPAQDARRTYGTELLDPNGTGPSTTVTEIGGFPNGSWQRHHLPGGGHEHHRSTPSLDPPQWTPGPSLQVARANHNTLWLPDGTELTIGGGNGMQNGSTYVLQNGKPEHQIELYDPAHPENGWVLGPAQQIDRAYHSTAVLLPDGRVLSAGDDNPYVYGKPYEGSDHNSGEIYSPPYLFRGTRPEIDSAPESEDYGAKFHVALSQVDPQQAHALLIPPAASTHSTNPNPRIVPLESAPTEDGLNLTAPANADIAPPGYYMLFVVNSDGVPSVARWVRIGTPTRTAAGRCRRRRTRRTRRRPRRRRSRHRSRRSRRRSPRSSRRWSGSRWRRASRFARATSWPTSSSRRTTRSCAPRCSCLPATRATPRARCWRAPCSRASTPAP